MNNFFKKLKLPLASLLILSFSVASNSADASLTSNKQIVEKVFQLFADVNAKSSA